MPTHTSPMPETVPPTTSSLLVDGAGVGAPCSTVRLFMPPHGRTHRCESNLAPTLLGKWTTPRPINARCLPLGPTASVSAEKRWRRRASEHEESCATATKSATVRACVHGTGGLLRCVPGREACGPGLPIKRAWPRPHRDGDRVACGRPVHNVFFKRLAPPSLACDCMVRKPPPPLANCSNLPISARASLTHAWNLPPYSDSLE